MCKAYTFLAEGFEETEAITVTDILLRAGVNVELISISDNLFVKGAHGIEIKANHLVRDISDDVELLFLPGGMPGAVNLGKCGRLTELLIQADKNNKRIAAICAAPSVLGILGLLKGKRATCYPGFEPALEGAEFVTDKVVTDGNITTSRGMGTAVDLGLELVRIFYDTGKAEKIKADIEYM